jgi:hypothetical protein
VGRGRFALIAVSVVVVAVAGLGVASFLRARSPLLPLPAVSGSSGAAGRGNDRAERADVPEVLPTGRYPGPRLSVALPPEACSPFGDSASAIESFLATVSNGARVEFPERGACLIGESLDLGFPPRGEAIRAGTVYDLNGSVLFRPVEPACPRPRDCNAPIVDLTLVWDVTLRDGAIAGGAGEAPGYDPDWEHDHAVAVHGSSAVTLIGLRMERVGGDCVDVDRAAKTFSRNIRVIGTPEWPTLCLDAARQGVSANEVEGLTVSGVRFDRIARSAVDLEPRGNGFIRGATITQNLFGAVGNYAVAGVGGSSEWQDVTVSNNRQESSRGLGFLRVGNSFERGPLTVLDNMVVEGLEIRHTSGRAEGNIMAGAQASVPCLFVLYRAPAFEARGNDPPPGTSEACVIDIVLGVWDEAFDFRDPAVRLDDGRVRFSGELEHVAGTGCPERAAEVEVVFESGGERVGVGRWTSPEPMAAGLRVPFSASGEPGAVPDRIVVAQTAGDCT